MNDPMDKSHDTTQAQKPPGDLPMRQDVPLEDRAQHTQKDIHKTTGGRLVDLGVFYGVGWIGNSAGSLFTTYFLNPLDGVAKGKEKITSFIVNKIVKNGAAHQETLHNKTLDSVRSTVEILFMFISGIVATGIMTPLAKNRGNMAHTVNQWLGNKDKDLLPNELQPQPEPKTVEDKIQRELDKRVNRKHSAGDIWKARAAGMGLVLGGDYAVNRMSRNLEKSGKQSVDTLSWRLGQKIYNLMPPKAVERWTNFFSKHGASFEKMEKNMKEHFDRLKETEINYGSTEKVINKDRMVIAEQTRLVTKEAGWTLIMAIMMHQFVKAINHRRVKKEQQEAIADITHEGLVPKGYKVVIGEDVKLEQVATPAAKNGSWAQKSGAEKPKPQKQENFVQAVDSSRVNSSERPALG